MKITCNMLVRANACSAQIRIFDREWPEGAEVTLENALRADELGLDLDWFVRCLFSRAARSAYFKAITPAKAAYSNATDPTWAAYHAMLIPAQAAFNGATAAAHAAHSAAVDVLLRDFESTQKTAADLDALYRGELAARAAYETATKAALSEFNKATAPMRDAYIKVAVPASAVYDRACAVAFFETFELGDTKYDENHSKHVEANPGVS